MILTRVLAIILCLSMTSPALAQDLSSLLSPDTAGINLVVNNSFPQPGQTVKISIDDYTLSNRQGTINWRRNGETVPQYNNAREISLVMGTAGQTETFDVTYTTPQGTVYRDRVTITPQYLDVIIEPLTYTPVMYQGRALPIERSQVVVTALLFNDTSPINASEYFYRWELNGQVLNQGPVRGLFKTLITIPMGLGSNLVVDISDARGNPVGKRRVSIPSQKVDVRFYEVSPLFGLGYTALSNPILQGGSLTVYAIPYNIDMQQPLSSQVTEWKVDGRRTTTGENPFLLTINRQNQRNSRIEFSIRNRIELLQGGEGAFRITY